MNAFACPTEGRPQVMKQLPKTIRLLKHRNQIRKALILHNARYTKDISTSILLNILCHSERGRFIKPRSLGILLIHNREYKTVVEKSMDFLGIEGYSVVRPYLPKGHWRNTYKIRAALDFARDCRSEFILHVDSDDAVLIGDPQRAIDNLEDSGGQMLLSTTEYTAYDFMPDRELWFNEQARIAGWGHSRSVHVNAGAYVARRVHLIEFLEAAAAYVTDDEPRWSDYVRMNRPGVSSMFPLGCGSEQNIFRFLYPRFAESMRLDYAARLAFRQGRRRAAAMSSPAIG